MPIVGNIGHSDPDAFCSTANGTVRLSDEPDGLHFEADLMDADKRILEAVQSGLYQASVEMVVISDTWALSNDEYPLRTIYSAKLMGFGLTPQPAYPTTYVKQVRSAAQSAWRAYPGARVGPGRLQFGPNATPEVRTFLIGLQEAERDRRDMLATLTRHERQLEIDRGRARI